MSAVCARCQATLEPGALEGLCPRCLLQQAIQAKPAAEVATTAYTPLGVPSLEELAPLFPHLEILGLLGQGGMGVVYKARHRKLDRLVALKILPPEAANAAGFADRFVREARTLARLNHPNVVAVHDFGDMNGLYYLSMEYVDGVNLRQALTEGKLEPQRALPLVAELCAALQYAHEMGVVHRDIKPENVLLDRQGRVKVADFGLAKLIGQTHAPDRLTGTNQAMGTPHYVAPEQWEKPLTVDHRADIYSLGVVFYELLTGELPVGKFAPPSEKAAVDARVDDVVLRAIEKQPEQRYQRMSEMKTAVEGVEKTPPSQAPSVTGPSEMHWVDRYGPAWVCVSAIVFPLSLGCWWLLEQTIFLYLAFLIPAIPPLLWVVGMIVGIEVKLARERREAREKVCAVRGLTAQEAALLQVLEDAAYSDLFTDYKLIVLTYLKGSELAAARKVYQVGSDDLILAWLSYSQGNDLSGVLFGGQGLYWRNPDGTPHAGVGSISYEELARRRIINHGDAIYLSNDQYICPNEAETRVSPEVLTGLLYQLRDARLAVSP